MMINEIKETLQAETLTGMPYTDFDIKGAYSADLMSDVLAFCNSELLLITALTNAQVIRTAEFADIRVIIFVQGKRPDIDAVALSEKKGILLLATRLPMFEVCGRLYGKGLRS